MWSGPAGCPSCKAESYRWPRLSVDSGQFFVCFWVGGNFLLVVNPRHESVPSLLLIQNILSFYCSYNSLTCTSFIWASVWEEGDDLNIDRQGSG